MFLLFILHWWFPCSLVGLARCVSSTPLLIYISFTNANLLRLKSLNITLHIAISHSPRVIYACGAGKPIGKRRGVNPYYNKDY